MSNRFYPLFGRNATSNESDNDDNIPLSSLANHVVKRRKRPTASREENHTSKKSTKHRIVPVNETRQSETKQREKEHSEDIDHSKEKTEVTTSLSSEETKQPEEKEKPETSVDGRCRNNIIHQLIQREATSRRPLPHPPAAHATWSLYSRFLPFGQVTAIAWDHVGVLLAIATTNRNVLVLDWDVVRVSRATVMEPLCTFSVSNIITNMQWDTGDCLAMSFRGTSQVRVYDVARVVHGNVECCTCLDTTFATKSAVALQCLPRRQWLVAYGDGLVILWKYSRGNATPVWKWRDSTVFARIHPFGGSTTVLLTNDRVWVALDWNHCTRAPFSSEKTPTILKSWNNLGNVRALSLKHDQYCTWVNAEGWVRSVDLHGGGGNNEKRILHGPPPLFLQTTAADGSDETRKSSQLFSQPLQAVAACATSSFVVWETVPQVTHILPHHDRRNVGGTLQVVRSPQRSLRIMDSYDRIVEIPMHLYSIDQVTLHPSNEWLVVAGGGQLQVWIARKLPKRRCDNSSEETL